MIETIYINLGILALNLFVLGLTLKLYTEILKDRAQDDRARSKEEDAVERAARRCLENEKKRTEEKEG